MQEKFSKEIGLRTVYNIVIEMRMDNVNCKSFCIEAQMDVYGAYEKKGDNNRISQNKRKFRKP